MGKKIINICFILTFGYAVYIFVSRDSRTLRENMEEVDHLNDRPKLLIDHYISTRYAGNQPISKTKGQTAHFEEPNKLHMQGDVEGLKYKQPHNQIVRAEQAIASFEAKSIQQVLDGAETKNIILKNYVRLIQGSDTIFSDLAIYDVKSDLVTSEAAVRVVGEKRWFTGANGFKYDVKTSNVEVMGPIEGVIDPNELSNEKD